MGVRGSRVAIACGRLDRWRVCHRVRDVLRGVAASGTDFSWLFCGKVNHRGVLALAESALSKRVTLTTAVTSIPVTAAVVVAVIAVVVAGPAGMGASASARCDVREVRVAAGALGAVGVVVRRTATVTSVPVATAVVVSVVTVSIASPISMVAGTSAFLVSVGVVGRVRVLAAALLAVSILRR